MLVPFEILQLKRHLHPLALPMTPGQTLEDLALDVLDRTKAREPYLKTVFSQCDVNTQLQNEHHLELIISS
jgi:hypothetical protein